jgi:hypothetical protein
MSVNKMKKKKFHQRSVDLRTIAKSLVEAALKNVNTTKLLPLMGGK